MPGMNSGLNVNDPPVVAAFHAALAHQALNPQFAEMAMSASSLIVVGNRLRLRRFRPPGGPR